MAATFCLTTSPMQSGAKATGVSSNFDSLLATGCRLQLSSVGLFGRPKCEIMIIMAPCFFRYSSVGTDWVIR